MIRRPPRSTRTDTLFPYTTLCRSGAMVRIDPDDPMGHKAIVEEQSVRIVRRRGDLIISETRHGFVCANAGVDLSNVDDGWAALLPVDLDRSARRNRDGVRAHAGVEVAVVVSATFGRAWRPEERREGTECGST